MFQRVRGGVHYHHTPGGEVREKRSVHVAEQGRGHRCVAELAILDGVNPAR